ncbi:hypothetical protein PR202_gb18927 [Eleusine coracana subsp. coracana]|uniref:Uncharacterized protein n=1 Tax=Eleusine coracana subsp. coracana TaxID=191504 RepID=A0AAV5F7G2_ELECO|nr:hypothetical protein QOZ80_3BG0290340 [Eleusine coracana subsp. coracana]GJN30608.1 hypothetical protein PR202_gb18927 [Eleusine coracana subsp. coracana]
MGNCQAAEVATVVIQHPGEGRTERAYWALSAGAVMAANPGHYVAAVITSPPDPSSSSSGSGAAAAPPVKHLKLLRPDDTLLLGRVYRLVSFEEVLREFTSKRHVKLSRVTIKAKDDDGEVEKKPAKSRRRRANTGDRDGGERKESDRSLAKVMRQAEEPEPEHEPSGPDAPAGGNAAADAPSDIDRDLEALVQPHGMMVGRRFARQWRPALQSIAEA